MRVSLNQIERLRISEGREVEVCHKDNGIWYKAIIEATAPTKPKSTQLRRFCVRLLKDNFATPFNEVSENVRPVPPYRLQARIDVKKGCVVDAEYKNGWRVGFVIKEIEDDGELLVFFDSPTDVIQFRRKHFRPHLDWVDERFWVLPKPKVQVLKRLTEESMFSSGEMVEVSSTIDKMGSVWGPAMVVEEVEEGDEKRYVVKFSNKPLNCKDNKANVTVDSASVRPNPPLLSVKEFKVSECIEAFRGSKWCKGIVKRIICQKQCMVSFEGTRKHMVFSHSDLRPPMEWENGFWKTSESSFTKESDDQMGTSVMISNTTSLAKEDVSPVTPSAIITVTPSALGQKDAELQEKTLSKSTDQLMRDHNGLGNDSTQEKERSKNNNRKRKREQIVNETRANDTTMVLPFEKTLPIWKRVESMEVYKTNPQSPHFSPLVETQENSREMSAVGMMLTYSTLLEEMKNLQPFDRKSSLESLNDSFIELERHGFNVKAPQSRIQKILSLKGRQAEKMEQLKIAEKEIAEKESEMANIKQKIQELQRLEENTTKEIAQIKPRAATIEQELEDVSSMVIS